METETDKRVINFLMREAKKYPWIKTIILFGSRARDDAKETSDFDLAVVTEGECSKDWSFLSSDWDEQIPTLCSIDLIHLNTLNNEPLKDSIKKEGIIIYERHN